MAEKESKRLKQIMESRQYDEPLDGMKAQFLKLVHDPTGVGFLTREEVEASLSSVLVDRSTGLAKNFFTK